MCRVAKKLRITGRFSFCLMYSYFQEETRKRKTSDLGASCHLLRGISFTTFFFCILGKNFSLEQKLSN